MLLAEPFTHFTPFALGLDILDFACSCVTSVDASGKSSACHWNFSTQRPQLRLSQSHPPQLAERVLVAARIGG